MAYFDSKYNIDEETARLPNTVLFFPDWVDFNMDLEEDSELEPCIMNEWAIRKLGTLQAKLEAIQHSRDVRRFGNRDNLNNFSRNIVYNLANEVFGYNGWSTSIMSCDLTELPVKEEGKFSAFCLVEIRLILKDDTYRDAKGVGESTNMPYKYMCYQTAKKKAVTDAMKSAIIGLRDLYFEYEMMKLNRDADLFL